MFPCNENIFLVFFQVGAMEGSPEFGLGIRLNAKMNTGMNERVSSFLSHVRTAQIFMLF